MLTLSVLFTVCTTWLYVSGANGAFNLYMNQTEAKRVLGIRGSVYFIRSGVVKKNAVKFDMRIPSSINCLGFTWYRETPSVDVTYWFIAQSLNPELLQEPTFNIQTKGQVPLKKKGFCVKMECKGTLGGTASIQLNMSFYLTGTTTTGVLQLSMKRSKTCRKVLPFLGSPTVASRKDNLAGGNESFSTSEKTKVFYIAVGVACSIIFIIALAVAAIHVQSMPSPNKDGSSVSEGSIHGHANAASKPAAVNEDTVHTTLIEQPSQVAMPAMQALAVNYKPINPTNCMPSNVPRTNHIPVQVQINQPFQGNLAPPRTRYMAVQAGPGIQFPNGDIPSATSRTHSISSSIMGPMRNHSESSAPSELYPHAGGLTSTQKGKYGNRDIKSELRPLDVDLDRITLGDLLYEGTFARIYEGVLTGPDPDVFKQQSVLVKTVSEIASTEQVNLMLIESSMLRDLTHINLLPITSVCLEDEKQPLVMFQFMNRGNLKLFLKKSRSPEGMSKSITTADLVHIGIQIAKGMQYLARRKIVHKDLAARNCFLDDELNVKVTDCALSRDLFPNDYCCLCDNENRPVKWMSVESLEHNRYSVASDVWAYGVLLWELMTLAQQPYANIDAFEMLSFLKKGHRIAQPLNCPDELFTVIACCWALSEDERPSFGQLIGCLTEFNNALSNFV